jgi:DNA-binding transcriptional regulator/RsmH inhibitor MraZ
MIKALLFEPTEKEVKQLLVLGVKDHLEVWTENTWQINSASIKREYDSLTERLAFLIDNYNKVK